jgi:hypothetical protein
LNRYEDSEVDTERVTWEYRPHQVHVVDMGPYLGVYLVPTNLNQAIFILPREQIKDFESRCNYLSDPGQNYFYRELRCGGYFNLFPHLNCCPLGAGG